MSKKLKKKKGLAKLWLKLSDREKYLQYKVERWAYGQKNFIDENKVPTPDDIKALAKKRGEINFLHDGNAGDIIYSLPTIRAVKRLTGVPVHLHLRLNQPHGIPSHHTHPLGRVMLNEKMFHMLRPLLESQEYLDSCRVYEQQTIDMDLNTFRSAGILLDRGNIARWYNYVTGLHPDLSEAWLEAKPSPDSAGHIVIARSSRYRNPYINYRFLSRYKQVIFLGVESEYEDMRQQIPQMRWVTVEDFRQMAELIAGARVFIGNQSFPFAIAEGLKVKRILETSVEAPNVIPEGGQAYDFYFQPHFEWLTEYLSGDSTPQKSVK